MFVCLLDPSTQIVYVVVYDSRLQIDLNIASSEYNYIPGTKNWFKMLIFNILCIKKYFGKKNFVVVLEEKNTLFYFELISIKIDNLFNKMQVHGDTQCITNRYILATDFH